MKYNFLNLKRFDIPIEAGGVNRIAATWEWGSYIIKTIQNELDSDSGAVFTVFFPESHLCQAIRARQVQSPVSVGCQSVFRQDTESGGNFGAFTSNRTANAMKAIGCEWTIIGHCEERRDKYEIISESGGDVTLVDHLLNRQIACAIRSGLNVLYCIGETREQQHHWQETLRTQIQIGLSDIDQSKVCIAYEPVWAIGPGKTPPDRNYIQMVAQFIKKETRGLPVVYGGGLKEENAMMLATIPEIDGALIALTRFSGEIGFYPDEYLQLIKKYMEACIHEN